jgi:hypothetical protein
MNAKHLQKPEEWVNIVEAAQISGRKKKTLQNWISSGRLPFTGVSKGIGQVYIHVPTLKGLK